MLSWPGSQVTWYLVLVKVTSDSLESIVFLGRFGPLPIVILTWSCWSENFDDADVCLPEIDRKNE